MSLIGIALVGSSTLHREGLRQSLDQDRFTVIVEGRDFSNVLAAVGKNISPHLVVADFGRLCETDFEGIQQLNSMAPGCRIVVLSNELNLSDMARVLRAGAVGYLVSELSCEALSLSLLLVMKGEKVLPGSLADVLASNDRELSTSKIFDGRSNLTDRERQILQCLLSGYSNKLIARVLNITEGTVKVHLKALMKKISAVNRTQAALWARSHGIGQDSEASVSQRTLVPPDRKEQGRPPLMVGKSNIAQSSQTNGPSHPTLRLSVAQCDDCQSATQYDGSLHRVGRKRALSIDRGTRSE